MSTTPRSEEADRALTTVTPKCDSRGVVQLAWEVVAPDTLEQVVAVLVHREHPKAQRIRASRGDKGIDILDPVSQDHEDIYQVKRFANVLTSARKRHIADSLQQARSQRGGRIRSWYLVLPMDRTTELDQWFNELTDGVGFDCQWLGLTYLDSLAARYPDVIDYYLRDGRARLEAQLQDLRTLAGLQEAMQPEAAIRSAEAVALVGALTETINRLDPHFDYELQAGPVPPSQEELLAKSGAIGSLSRWDGATAQTVTIFPKYEAALLDRPIPITANLCYAPTSDVGIAIERFVDYGTPVELPEGVLKGLTISMPGGLGGTFTSGSAQLRSSARAPHQGLPPLRAEIRDPDGAPISELIFLMTSSTGGKRGLEVLGRDLANLVELTVLIPRPGGSQTGGSTIRSRGFFDKPARTIHTSVRFLQALRNGNRLEFTMLDGDRFMKPSVIGEEFGDGSWLDDVVYVLDDLLELQSLAPHPLILAEDMSALQMSAIHDAAQLVRGERVVGTWTDITVNVYSDKLDGFLAHLEQPMAVAIEGKGSVDIGGVSIDLGAMRQIATSAVLRDEPTPNDDGTTHSCVLVPATSNTVETIRL